MITLRIRLLTGRYAATSYNDRDSVEWPPHPARVFSALVAAHYAVEEPSSDERRALEWLQCQGPPQLTASTEIARRDTPTFYVPVNDPSVVSNAALDNAWTRVEAAEAAHNEAKGAMNEAQLEDAPARAVARLEKAVERASGRLTKVREAHAARVDTDTREADKLTASAVDTAGALLPEGRTRQARTFPSATPAEPEVMLSWTQAEPTPELLASLDLIASRVTRIGHSSSLVSCAFVDGGPPDPTWLPDDDGELILRVVNEGQLARLDAEFQLHQAVLPRVLPCAFQRYGLAGEATREPVPEPVFGSEWLVFSRVGGPRLPLSRVEDVARAMRGALLSHAVEPIPEVLTGHGHKHQPSNRPHVAFLPLPWVGREHADGTLMGVALVPPRELPPEDLQALYLAVGHWERSVAEGDNLALVMGRAGRLEVERVLGQPRRWTLRSRTWCRPSDRWVSATPVALDHNPGNLLSNDPDVAERAFARAEEIIGDSVERLGLPRPESVEVRFRAGLHGARSSRKHPSFPADRRKTRRVLVHATLQFSGPVRGPLLVGAGRYLGLGLFFPLGGGHASR